ncbi:MAG: ferrous iron transport protein A [Candidatus Omnitrophica bacterium]|nr:ferrous iron transport protein A [Candidatus Omnitrophota bacterium]
MICDLCHHEFNESEARGACSGCGTQKSCGGVRCPRCYYEMVSAPGWISGIARFFNRKSGREAVCEEKEFSEKSGVSLNEFEVNRSAEIVDLRTVDNLILRKIIAMDALPGAKITLVQKFPSLVFRINESSFSIDKELASVICVKPI